MRRILSFGAALLLYHSITQAGTPSQALSIRAALADVPRAELPAKVSALIQSASCSNRLDTTLITVRTAIRLHGAAAPAVVGAAVRTVPDLAAGIAETAARERPKLASRIAKAAAAAAPSQAGRIVVATCRAVPGAYREIVLSVAEVVPESRIEILECLGIALPDLEPAIHDAIESAAGKPVSVAGVLDAAALALNSRTGSAATAAGSAVEGVGGNTRLSRPPFIPLSGHVISGSERNYATP